MSNWLVDKLIPSIMRSEVKKSSVPEGLWHKCPSCDAVLYRPELEKTLDVCPKCNHHMRIGARARIDIFLDADGRLWFCGRKAERVTTIAGPLFTEPCEQVFRSHPSVARCALVGLGARPGQEPAIVIEAADSLDREHHDQGQQTGKQQGKTH